MLLDADTFNSIVQQLGPGAAPTGGGQRREPRTPLSARLTMLPCPLGLQSPGEPLSVPVRDLSRGGLRFLLPRRLPLDTSFVLFLPRPTSNVATDDSIANALAGTSPMAVPPLAVHCAVTWWQPVAAEQFMLGARFVEVLQHVVVPMMAARTVLPEIGANTPEPQRVAS